MIKTIRSRWLVSCIILVLLNFLLVGFLVYYNFENYIIRQLISELEKQLILVRILTQAKPEGVNLDDYAKKLGSELNAQLTFIAADGRVLADTQIPLEQIQFVENHLNRPEIISAMNGNIGHSIRYSQIIRSKMIYVAIPWIKNDISEGFIRLAVSMTPIENKLLSIRRWYYFGSLIILILAISMGILISNSITRPIKQLAFATAHIAQEDFNQKINIESPVEFNQLAHSLNHMTEKLARRFQTIQNENTQLETILSSMTEGVMVLDKNGKIVLTNNAFQKIFQISGKTERRAPVELIRNQEVAQALINGLDKGEIIHREIILSGANLKIIQLYGAPLRKENQITGLVTVFHDITDLRALEQIRRDFVANVSHELKTPLTVIRGFSETLLDGALTDLNYARKFIENIYQQTQRMNELVDDLLLLSRIESGKTELKFEPHNIQDMLKSVLDLLIPKAAQKNISFQTIIPNKPITMNCDRKYIEQMLVNLLDNAIKFSKPDSFINIHISENVSELEIKISDSGRGIPSEDLPRIFERFYRVDKSRSTESEGTGLGLSIVKHIIDAHHGNIHVESRLGQGTQFIIQFLRSI